MLQRSGRPTYSIPTAADALGVPAEDVEHAWALRGLTVASPDHLALSQADVDGLAAWLKMKAFLGSEGAFGALIDAVHRQHLISARTVRCQVR